MEGNKDMTEHDFAVDTFTWLFGIKGLTIELISHCNLRY
jgi:hypothetical protein